LGFAFYQRSAVIYHAFDGQTEFSRLFIFAILFHSRYVRKFHVCKYNMAYVTVLWTAAGIAITSGRPVDTSDVIVISQPAIG